MIGIVIISYNEVNKQKKEINLGILFSRFVTETRR